MSRLLDRDWDKLKQELAVNQEVTLSLADSLAREVQLEQDNVIYITPNKIEDRPLLLEGICF